MTFGQCFGIGAEAGALVFFICLCIRITWRNHIIRKCKTMDYVIGWKDALKEVQERIDWVKISYDDKQREKHDN